MKIHSSENIMQPTVIPKIHMELCWENVNISATIPNPSKLKG